MKIEVKMIDFIISDKKYLVTYGDVMRNRQGGFNIYNGIKIYVNTKNGVDKIDLEEKLKIIRGNYENVLPNKFKKYRGRMKLLEYIEKIDKERKKRIRFKKECNLIKSLGGFEGVVNSFQLENKVKIIDYIVDLVEYEVNLGLREPLHVTI